MAERFHGMEEVRGSIPLSSTDEGPGRETWAFLVIEFAEVSDTSTDTFRARDGETAAK